MSYFVRTQYHVAVHILKTGHYKIILTGEFSWGSEIGQTTEAP